MAQRCPGQPCGSYCQRSVAATSSAWSRDLNAADETHVAGAPRSSRCHHHCPTGRPGTQPSPVGAEAGRHCHRDSSASASQRAPKRALLKLGAVGTRRSRNAGGMAVKAASGSQKAADTRAFVAGHTSPDGFRRPIDLASLWGGSRHGQPVGAAEQAAARLTVSVVINRS